MPEKLRFTPDTEISVTGWESADGDVELDDVHLHDLAFIADIAHADGEIEDVTIDLPELVRAITLYSSMEKQRYGWRRVQN